MLKIYHNPRCSKSRQAVQYLQENNYQYEVIEYLKMPLEAVEIEQIISLLQVDIKQILRVEDQLYKNSNLANLGQAELIQKIILQPALLQRPIIISDNAACIARPLDNLINMLTKNS
jgi:arsenate reductase